jgi:hypothetical protein
MIPEEEETPKSSTECLHSPDSNSSNPRLSLVYISLARLILVCLAPEFDHQSDPREDHSGGARAHGVDPGRVPVSSEDEGCVSSCGWSGSGGLDPVNQSC